MRFPRRMMLMMLYQCDCVQLFMKKIFYVVYGTIQPPSTFSNSDIYFAAFFLFPFRHIYKMIERKIFHVYPNESSVRDSSAFNTLAEHIRWCVCVLEIIGQCANTLKMFKNRYGMFGIYTSSSTSTFGKLKLSVKRYFTFRTNISSLFAYMGIKWSFSFSSFLLFHVLAKNVWNNKYVCKIWCVVRLWMKNSYFIRVVLYLFYMYL